MEEYNIIRSTVQQFVNKNIESNTVNIERKGIPKELIEKMGAQGFLTARALTDNGKPVLDDKAYMIILEEIARSSPSVALKVFITNLFFEIYNPGDELLNAVKAGEMNVSVAFPEAYKQARQMNYLRIEGNKIVGTKENVINGDCDRIIISAGTENNLYLVKSGFKPKGKYHLGIRGLDFSDVQFDTDDYHLLRGKNLESLTEVLVRDEKIISAIFIGLSEGVIDKAIEYSKARSAFDHPLKDFGPISSQLMFMKTEIDLIKSYAYSATGKYESAISKIKAKKISLDAARLSLQIHGGYGYIEDFGIEKFYRDSMALTVIFGNDTYDNAILSDHIFGGKSGFI